MKLTVTERLVLLGILPQEQNFATLKLLRVAKESLSFNDIENQKLKFVQTGDMLNWDEKAAAEVNAQCADIAIGDTVTQMIVDALKKLDEEKKLTEEHFSLYEKFIV